MAVSVQKSEDLRRTCRRYRGWSYVGIFCAFGCFLAYILTMNRGHLLLTAGLPVMVAVCLGISKVLGKKADIYTAGISGEYALLRLLEALPDTWYLFSNVKQTWKDKSCEMDLVAVGPGGVFVIENKNQKGSILAEADSRTWKRQKNARQDHFYSPVRQVKTHIYVLANVLRSHGLRVFVKGAVFFSHPEAAVTRVGAFSEVPVFSMADGAEALLKHLKEERNLTPDQIREVCRVLDGKGS